MIKRIISVLLLSVFLVLPFSNNTYANIKQKFTIESYKKYLLDTNNKESLENFNKLTIKEKNELIKLINDPNFISNAMNGKYPESKVKVERNNRTKKIIQIQERIPSGETWKIQRYYTEQDIIVHAIGINLIVVTGRLEYTTRGPRVLSIDDWSMRISRNISGVSVDISDVSKRIESKNPKGVQSGFREWAVLRGAIRFNVWYGLDIVLNETNYELWVSAKGEVKTQKL